MCTFPSACLPHERYFPSITTFPPQGIFPLGQYLHLNEYFPMNKYASTKLVSPENGKWWLCPCRSKEKLLKVCCWGWCMCCITSLQTWQWIFLPFLWIWYDMVSARPFFRKEIMHFCHLQTIQAWHAFEKNDRPPPFNPLMCSSNLYFQ